MIFEREESRGELAACRDDLWQEWVKPRRIPRVLDRNVTLFDLFVQ